ncbi:MAG: lipid hydroperoxide peroxidase, partial [Planctomycetota bacterium]
MKTRTGVVTMKGNVLTLQGNDIEAGDKAPDFEVLDNDLATVKLSDYTGKVV